MAIILYKCTFLDAVISFLKVWITVHLMAISEVSICFLDWAII